MSTTATPSASYAAEVARLLWPAPWAAPEVTRDRLRTGASHRDAYIFPSRRRPRLLVPTDLPGSSSMLRRLGPSRSQLARPARRVLERSVRSPAFALTRWPILRVQATDDGADSIECYLGESLGAGVRVGILLGTRRVNQKPVLQVFGLDGTVLGYAKVGHNELTAALVRREADALRSLAGLLPHSLHLPEVMHHGRWSDLEVLVLSPLPTSRKAVTPGMRLAASRELGELAGTLRSPLARTGFWSRRRETGTGLAATPAGGRLGTALSRLEEQHGGDEITLGGWHGDWGHWNMGVCDGALQVWDWERYDAEVPIGFDALHFAAQRVRPGEREHRRQEAAFLASVPEILAQHGVRTRRHELTLRLYLLEVSLRYVDALRFGQTPALQRRTDWVLSLLESRLDSTPPRSSEGPS